ncbi:MAG: hypothetical protein SX243_01720 [Acidobacteriota bacterium]|nr:hypothetical protein [Acidobacteriota bacterium]
MRSSAPPGHAIAQAASKGRLRKNLSVEGKHQGEKVRFTPAEMKELGSMEEL